MGLIDDGIKSVLLDRVTWSAIFSTAGIKISDEIRLISWDKVLTKTMLILSIILALINIIYKIHLMIKKDDKS